ncbi:hypothetical protein [Leptolinea tardivitalis]|nr:hypothetical protein [Leptolinea tardivitalis]
MITALFIYNRCHMACYWKNYQHNTITLVAGLTMLLAACSPAAPTVSAQTEPTGQPTFTQAVATQTLTAVEITSTGQPVPTIGSQTTPTIVPPAADRQPPEDWQNWPVIPVVSARSRQIYEAGLAAGTDPTRFSKVGDCQAIKNVLLGMYDKPSGYTLRENADALNETIRQFAGSFDRDGEAVQGGFNAASELTPLMSNPEVCEPGETPLECEIRVHNPSILIVSLEVWWNGRSPDVYEKNMRQIIEYAISKGILPILSTKADNVEGDNSINLVTAKLAYEYDIPLWNWWKAAQALPNHGLDPNRPDGFHISQEFAWPERSFTALQALDAVWRGVRGEATAAAKPTETPETPKEFNPLQSTAASTEITPVETTPACSDQPAGDGVCPMPSEKSTQSSTGILTIKPVEAQILSDPSGFVLLSTARRGSKGITPLGVYLINPVNGTSFQILPEGVSLQAVSPDARQILFSRGQNLFTASLDGSDQPVLISNRFSDRGGTSAAWMADGKSVTFLAEQDGDRLLVLYAMDGSAAWKRLSPIGVTPVAIYPFRETGRIYWSAGTCPASGSCTSTNVMVSGLDGSSAEYLPKAVKAGFSSDGRWMAYEDQAGSEKSQLTLATVDLSAKRPQENIGDQILDFSWSPDGTRLSLLSLQRSDYSGQWLDIRNLVISTQDMGTKILPTTSGMNPRAIWSADGRSLLLTGTQQSDTGFSIHLNVMDTTSGTVRDLTPAAALADKEFIYTTRIDWVKPAP